MIGLKPTSFINLIFYTNTKVIPVKKYLIVSPNPILLKGSSAGLPPTQVNKIKVEINTQNKI